MNKNDIKIELEDINEVFDIANNVIIKKKLYLIFKNHFFGNFDFQNSLNNYRNYEVKHDKLIANIGKLVELEKFNKKDHNYGDYYLIKNTNWLLTQLDFQSNNFLETGIYGNLIAINNTREIKLALFSLNFEPKIYSFYFNAIKPQGSQPFFLTSAIRSISFDYAVKELTLSFNDNYNTHTIKSFLNINDFSFKNQSQIKLATTSVNEFNWHTYFQSLKIIVGKYLFDSDVNILNRADLVNYLYENRFLAISKFNNLEKNEQEEFKNFYITNKEQIDLIGLSLDLSENKYYSNFDSSRNSWGANDIITVLNKMYLQSTLSEEKSVVKKLKI